MPKVESDVPEKLRPYIFHGVDLLWKDSDKEAVGDCPWCGREGKFSVNIETGQWQCFICREGSEKGGGNIWTFLQLLLDKSDEATTEYDDLLADRRIMEDTAFLYWKIVRSITTNEWLVPAYNYEGKLRSLYRYVVTPQRKLLLPTPTVGHHLHGVNLYSKAKPVVYLCEGIWDAIALWEILGKTKLTDEGYKPTANAGSAILSEANVLATPTCTVFSDTWLPLFEGKTVKLMFDNDHPRKHPNTGAIISPAAYAAMERITKEIGSVAEQVKFLKWSSGDGTYDPTLPSGYDVRDKLTLRR